MDLAYSLTHAELVNGLTALAVLLAKFFAFAIYRRHSLAERTSREAAENLWHVRQVTAALFGDTANRVERLKAVVAKAPLDVILHMLRMHVGGPRQDLLDACEAISKFRRICRHLADRDRGRALRALEEIEVCSTPTCIAAVRLLMYETTDERVRLAATWTLVRMDKSVEVGEIAAVLSGFGAANPPIRDAVERDLAARYTGSVDTLLATFARLGNSAAGIRLLGKLKTDEAVWQLLLLAGNCDDPVESALASQSLASAARSPRNRLQPSTLETRGRLLSATAPIKSGTPRTAGFHSTAISNK